MDYQNAFEIIAWTHIFMTLLKSVISSLSEILRTSRNVKIVLHFTPVIFGALLGYLYSIGFCDIASNPTLCNICFGGILGFFQSALFTVVKDKVPAIAEIDRKIEKLFSLPPPKEGDE